ncbi:MAG: Type 1 glutamine amidotransferase-like domain-containing protein [Promethearchaeota archaeon]
MKRIVLFSEIEKNTNSQDVLEAIFPNEIENKTMLFMPSGGINTNYQHFYDEWERFCKEYGATFELVDNSIPLEETEKVAYELQKIRQSNILVISGGDPFKMLYYLRRTGMDKEIKEFVNKENYVLAGYSAGAMILTPTIAITTMEVTNHEGNRVPIHDVRGKSVLPELHNDLTGLEIVDFEIIPHYEVKYAKDVELYRKSSKNKVKTCTDDDFYIIER